MPISTVELSSPRPYAHSGALTLEGFGALTDSNFGAASFTIDSSLSISVDSLDWTVAGDSAALFYNGDQFALLDLTAFLPA